MYVIERILKTIAQTGTEIVTCITYVMYGSTEGSISVSHILQCACLSKAFQHRLHANLVELIGEGLISDI